MCISTCKPDIGMCDKTEIYTVELQWLKLGWLFTTALSNLSYSLLEKSSSYRFGIIKADFLLYIENGMMCVLIRIPSMRQF